SGLRRGERLGGDHVPAGWDQNFGGRSPDAEGDGMTSLTVEYPVHFGRRGRAGLKNLAVGPQPPTRREGRVPRVARLTALAVRVDGLVREEKVASHAEVGRLGRMTRAQMSQIMNLVNLAPDIIEEIVHLQPFDQKALLVADLQPIAREPDWQKQRR